MNFLKLFQIKLTKPTIEPIDNKPPVINAAIKPPIKANGRFTSIKTVFLILLIAIKTKNNIPIKTIKEIKINSFLASAPSTAVPAILI